MAGLPERGFNSVRVEAGLNWCFRADGTPRGEMEFGSLFPVYVILTSWEYQDSNSLVADPKIRAEVMAVPEPQRFMALARHHDRLLRILEDKGLHKNIAYVEVLNEPDASKFPQGAEGKKLHQEAIAFLRDRHPDVLVSGDYCSHDPSIVPDNIQVYDQHVYVGLYTTALYPQTVWRKDFDPANPQEERASAAVAEEPDCALRRVCEGRSAGAEVLAARRLALPQHRHSAVRPVDSRTVQA